MKKFCLFLPLVLLFLILVLFTACEGNGTPVDDGAKGPDESSDPSVCVHEFGAWNEPTVTCSKSGYLGYYECRKCHKYFDEDYGEIDTLRAKATGHKGGEATCTSGSVCTVCKKEYSKPLGHDFAVSDLSVIGTDGKATLTCKRDPSHVECVEVISFTYETDPSYALAEQSVTDFIAKAKKYDTEDFTYTYATADVQNPKALPVTVWFSHEQSAEVKNRIPVQRVSIEFSKNADMSDSETYFATSSDYELAVNNMETGATYYTRATLELTDTVKMVSDVLSFTTDPGIRPLTIGKVANARDMGGWLTVDGTPVKQGMVIRCGALDKINDEGKSFLLDTIGIKTELDLRSDTNLIELEGSANRTESFLGSSVNYVRVSGEQGSKYFTSPAAAAQAMRVFTKPENYPIAVHCAAGADRTGVISLALKALIGVSENDAVADYELTLNRFRSGNDPTRDPDDRWLTCTDFLITLHAQNGFTFQEKATYFFDVTCGFTAMEISNIRNMMLGDSGVFVSDSLSATRQAKNVFHLDLRSSGGITAVSLDGSKADYTFDTASSALTVSGSLTAGKHMGKIYFADGGMLEFEIQA